MPPHNPLPCCNLYLFYSPPQVHFVDVFLDDLLPRCLWSAWSSFSMGFFFQWYRLLGIRSMFIRCKWLNHWRRRFLMTAVSWGWLVLDLVELFVIYWDHITHKIWRWQHMSKASSLALSRSVSVQHSHAYRIGEKTQALWNFSLVSRLTLRSLHTLSYSLYAAEAFLILLFSSLKAEQQN